MYSNEDLRFQQRQTRRSSAGAARKATYHHPAGSRHPGILHRPGGGAGGGNYQTVINNVLRDYIEGKRAVPELEDTLRRVIREELHPTR